jgi:hypothetical protein
MRTEFFRRMMSCRVPSLSAEDNGVQQRGQGQQPRFRIPARSILVYVSIENAMQMLAHFVTTYFSG